MPQDFRSGSIVSVPCRHCGRLALRVTLTEGSSSPVCARCGNVTDVKINVEDGLLRVRTAKGSKRGSAPS